jgi:aryl-alcohol dehydrogenase-like predicted oxidoreductase
MKYKLLGRTGVKVSELCFGTMSFGAEADAAESARMYKLCRDRGINFFDCADGYAGGRSEEILGELIAGERDELVITSKCFSKMGKDLNARGTNRRHMVRAVEASLGRLKTDRLDVLFMHHFDASLPMEEILRSVEDLVRSGKVIYVGVSNYAAWQIAKCLGISERQRWSRIDVIQPMYSLVKRQAEVEILPLAEHEDIGVISYSPNGGGLLSGKYSKTSRPNDGRLVTKENYARRYGEEWAYDVADQFTDFASKMGVHPVSLATAWVGGHPAITCPIVGARNVEQLTPSLDSVGIDMTPELRAEISALAPEPAPATDRLEERS